MALFPLSGKGFTSIVSHIQIFIKVTLLIIIMCPKITFSFFYAPSFQATTFIDSNRTMLSRPSELHSFINVVSWLKTSTMVLIFPIVRYLLGYKIYCFIKQFSNNYPL